jgi:putative transposase
VAVEIETQPTKGKRAIGIDFGCKDAATASDGDVLHGRWYRARERALATAQRAGKKKRAKAIHAKIKNRRKDAIHKYSTRIVKEHGAWSLATLARPVWRNHPLRNRH